MVTEIFRHSFIQLTSCSSNYLHTKDIYENKKPKCLIAYHMYTWDFSDLSL